MQSGDSAEPGTEALAPIPSTRQWLIDVAQREISEHGFTGVSMRSIAAHANVDPSLVRHYFGSKQNLLMQAVNVSLDAEEMIAGALRGSPAGVGRRTVKILLGLCDDERTAARILVGFSAPLSSPESAGLGSNSYLGALFLRIAEQVSPDRQELRASMVTAQAVALVIGRYLVRDPLMADSSQQDLARIIGRAVQDILTGPMPAEDASVPQVDPAGHGAGQLARK